MTARAPIRWRSTIWYALLFAATMLVFGAGLYALLQQRLFEAFDDQLADQAALVLAVIQDESGGLTVSGNIAPDDDDLFVRVFDLDGEVVAGTPGAMGKEIRRTKPVAAALRGRSRYSYLSVDRERLRVVAIPIRMGDGAIIGALQVGISPEDVSEALSEVASVLAVTAPLALLVAVGAGYLLAGRALRPVTTITDVAASIGGDDLHARLDLALPNNEIGRLANTFDRMLARIEDAFERQRRFTGDAAHELRTPLSLMRSQVDLALARPRSAEGTSDHGALPTRRHVVNGLGALALGSFGLMATSAPVFVALQPAASAAGRNTHTGTTNHSRNSCNSRNSRNNRRRRRR